MPEHDFDSLPLVLVRDDPMRDFLSVVAIEAEDEGLLSVLEAENAGVWRGRALVAERDGEESLEAGIEAGGGLGSEGGEDLGVFLLNAPVEGGREPLEVVLDEPEEGLRMNADHCLCGVGGSGIVIFIKFSSISNR